MNAEEKNEIMNESSHMLTPLRKKPRFSKKQLVLDLEKRVAGAHANMGDWPAPVAAGARATLAAALAWAKAMNVTKQTYQGFLTCHGDLLNLKHKFDRNNGWAQTQGRSDLFATAYGQWRMYADLLEDTY